MAEPVRRSARVTSKGYPAAEFPPPPPPTKKRKTVAESSREYRERLKSDPDKFEAYKLKQQECSRQYRSNCTEEQKMHQREQSRLRMQAMRERRKHEGAPVTRSTQEERRARWREEKRLQSAKITPQKRRRNNERRQQLYREKKEKQKLAAASCVLEHEADANLNHLSTSSPVTPSARRKAFSRAKAAMPKSPRKFVSVMNDLKNKASPRKRALFAAAEKESMASVVSESVVKELNSLTNLRSAEANRARKVLLTACRRGLKKSSVRAQSRSLGVHVSTVQRSSSLKKEQKDPRAKKYEADIQDFLKSSSVILPSKKTVSKKTGLAAAVLTKPLADLHHEFQQTTGQEVSFSHFARCRPARIRPARQNMLQQCLCEYCENINLKVKAVNGLAARINNACRIRHTHHAVDLITCGRQDGGKWHKDCAYGRCGQCSPDGLQAHLRPLLQHQVPLSWSRWESKAVVTNGKRITRKMLVKHQGIMTDLMEELRAEVVFLAQHLFRADWQYQQFNSMRSQSPPQGTVIMVLDFAENFTCSFQNEVQAAHWHHEQVTVHPTVTYYACPVCSEKVTESLVFISDDRTHDHHAVHHFDMLAINHLRTARGLDLGHIVQWTDGCAAQYKSKGPFSDITCAFVDFGCTMERNFFGSRHGKGPSDGESAVVKSVASRAVKGGDVVISNATRVVSFLHNISPQ